MARLCESCEQYEMQVIDSCDDSTTPYQLCVACQERLHVFSLRPIEWYNLAKRHGWEKFHLHDDFYDEDGTAVQPDSNIMDNDAYTMPRLSSVDSDPSLLLDYSITRWHIQSELQAAWIALPPMVVLDVLSSRFTRTANGSIKSRILQICALSLDGIASDFVRRCWSEYPHNISLSPLAQVSAACLPLEEGINRVKNAIAVFCGKKNHELMFALGYFHSTEVLDWIEQNVIEPITESWGYLAAASKIDWPRIQQWLEIGRPLSLVAIDALQAIVRPMSPFLRAYQPALIQPPTLSILQKTLTIYSQRDPVPRVQKRVHGILSNADLLVSCQ